uniref:Uncharacterized protein n=1 Tax=Salvator merianae TaxID=96440 RepID=A0A8D0BRX8_SALMN
NFSKELLGNVIELPKLGSLRVHLPIVFLRYTLHVFYSQPYSLLTLFYTFECFCLAGMCLWIVIMLLACLDGEYICMCVETSASAYLYCILLYKGKSHIGCSS